MITRFKQTFIKGIHFFSFMNKTKKLYFKKMIEDATIDFCYISQFYCIL